MKKIFVFVLLMMLNTEINSQTQEWGNYYSNHFIRTFTVDDSILWIGVVDNRIIKINLETGNQDTLKGEDYGFGQENAGVSRDVTVAIVDHYGTKWFGAGDCLVKYDNIAWTVDTLIAPITAMAVDINGNIWLGLAWYNGLMKFDGNEWTAYNTLNSNIPFDIITAISCDVVGNVWIGAFSTGAIAMYDGTNWYEYNNSISSLPSSDITSIIVDENNNKWFSTSFYSGGLAKYNNINWEIFSNSNSPLPSNYIFSTFVDQNNYIWIGTSEGLCKLDDITWTIFNELNSPIPNNSVLKIFVDRFNHKWILTPEWISVYREGGIGIMVGLEDDHPEPINFSLSQNYPNPFNPTTNIKYSIPKSGVTTLKIYDVIGKEIVVLVDESINSGTYEVIFEASNLPSGIYFYRLQSGNFRQTKKLILLK